MTEGNLGPPYQLNLMFEWGGGCLWPANRAALRRFGVGFLDEELGLSRAILDQLEALTGWHDGALDWSDPMSPSPWNEEEFVDFDAEAMAIRDEIQGELGSDFVVNYVELGRGGDDPEPHTVRCHLELMFGREGYLWPINYVARARFGRGAVDKQVELSANLLNRLHNLTDELRGAVDPSSRTKPFRWSEAELDAFENDVNAVLENIRQELGPSFLVTYQSGGGRPEYPR